jgi:hypothetical protein
MGLISGLLTLPLAPVRGVVWIAERILEQAEAELYDPDRIRAQLFEAHTALESGHITEEEYDEIESVLLERLATAHDASSRTTRPDHRTE